MIFKKVPEERPNVPPEDRAIIRRLQKKPSNPYTQRQGAGTEITKNPQCSFNQIFGH
jgi:hypothetical protein